MIYMDDIITETLTLWQRVCSVKCDVPFGLTWTNEVTNHPKMLCKMMDKDVICDRSQSLAPSAGCVL